MPHRWKAVALVAATTMTIGALSAAPAAIALPHQAAIAKAKTSLLVRSDFPSAWTTSLSSNGDRSPLDDSELASCLGVPLSQLSLNPPRADSPDFNQNKKKLSVDNEVSVFSSSAVALQQFNLFENTKTPGCIANTFNSPSVRSQFSKSLP